MAGTLAYASPRNAVRMRPGGNDMSQDVFVVAYDGQDQPVLDFAAERARKEGAQLHLIHVLEWSPYSFLTPRELAERHKERERDLARGNDVILKPALERLRSTGAQVEGEVRFGSIVDVIITVAREKNAVMIFAGRSNSLSERVFGSVASGLAQSAPVPTVIVP